MWSVLSQRPLVEDSAAAVRRAADVALSVALAAGVGLAAYLIIAIQPSVTLGLLPSTGGHPYLWHTTQVLFQAMLLAGYGLATCAVRWGDGWSTWYGAMLVAGALVAWTLPFGTPVIDPTAPWTWMAAIAVRTAVPFILLSTISIVGQVTLAKLRPGQEPTWLYAASNAGSLLAVSGYAFLVEPHVDISRQQQLWYGVSAALLACVGLIALGHRFHPSPPVVGVSTRAGSRLDPVRWFAGGACGVGLSLGATTYLATDLGSHPVVWLGPFGTYLATLVVAFSAMARRVGAQVNVLAAPALLVLLLAVFQRVATLWVPAVHLAALGVVMLTWHLWLVASCPDAGRLPRFYACMAAGGMAAGAAMSFVVPVALNPVLYGAPGGFIHHIVFGAITPEYLLVLLFTLAILRRSADTGGGVRRIGAAAEGAATGVLMAVVLMPVLRGPAPHRQWALAFAAVIVVAAAARVLDGRLRATAAALAVVTIALAQTRVPGSIVEHSRSAFGQLKIIDAGGRRTLYHGTTRHGDQDLRCVDGQPGLCREPSSYYSREGPVGKVIGALRQRRGRLDVGVVGLGTGSIASYCEGSDRFLFLEIDPAVVSAAERRFDYLRHSTAACDEVKVATGDARVLLRREPADSLDLLVVDAFVSDTVPAHLVTREAFAEYARLVRDPDGLMAVHVSSRLFDLVPVVGASGRAAGLHPAAVVDPGDGTSRRLRSTWVVFARRAYSITAIRALLFAPSSGPALRERRVDAATAWTDERHSLIDALR